MSIDDEIAAWLTSPDPEPMKVLWAVKDGDADWQEQIISTDEAKFAEAQKWAEAEGFGRFRISAADMSPKDIQIMGQDHLKRRLKPEPEPEPVKVPTMRELAPMIEHLRGNFIGRNQLRVMVGCCFGEEGDYFKLKIKEVYDLVTTMPKTGEQSGKGDEAIAYLHYFAGGQANFYITERDMGNPPEDMDQHQAKGLADLYGDGGEYGYISLVEILENNGELDLHWTPTTLWQLRAKRYREDEAAEREIREIEGSHL